MHIKYWHIANIICFKICNCLAKSMQWFLDLINSYYLSQYFFSQKEIPHWLHIHLCMNCLTGNYIVVF